MDKSKRCIIVKIPKTGGTTLGTIIAQNYHKKDIYYLNNYKVKESVDMFKSLSKQQRNNYEFYSGEMGFGLHKYLFGDLKYITMLRDPVDRVISYYYYLKRANFYGKIYQKVKKMSLEDYVSNSGNQGVNNEQTRLIIGNNGYPLYYSKQPKLTDDDFRKARNNLNNKFSMVGITEHFDKSIILFKKALNWNNIGYIKKNVTKNRPTKNDIDDNIIEKIKENNLYDIRLYDLAKQLFFRHVNNNKEYIQREMTLLNQKKENKQNYYEKNESNNIDYLNSIFKKLKKDEKSVVIYGAGEHTRRLLKKTILAKLNIVCIVDTYRTKHKDLNYDIFSPAIIKDRKPDTVIISSFAHEEEIFNYLKENLNYDGEIVRFYNCDADWMYV